MQLTKQKLLEGISAPRWG